jgi:hypothetical protein
MESHARLESLPGYRPVSTSIEKSNLNHPNTNGIFLNAQTAKDTDTQETTAISTHDASNAQVITPHSTATERNATILLTTKDAPSTRNSSQKTYPSLRPKQYLPPAPLQRTLHTSPDRTYAQIAKQHTPAASPITQDPHTPQPLPQYSDKQDLKDMLKQLFQQMDTMINLLTTVLTKLK